MCGRALLATDGIPFSQHVRRDAMWACGDGGTRRPPAHRGARRAAEALAHGIGKERRKGTPMCELSSVSGIVCPGVCRVILSPAVLRSRGRAVGYPNVL